jgi:hypothetical protein
MKRVAGPTGAGPGNARTRGFLSPHPGTPRMLFFAILLVGLAACAPPGRSDAPQEPTRRGGNDMHAAPDTDTAAAKDTTMNGSTSPTGQAHPGEIVHDDKVQGRTWTRKASDVPVSIAWVRSGDDWLAVVRIEIVGAGDHREITKFGPGGKFLESTLAQVAPAPPAPSAPQPVAVPKPEPR